MPAKRMPAISPAPTPSTRPTTSSRLHRPDADECRAFPPRLVSRRRHWRRQGPPGRRDHSRQLAQGPPPGGLDLQIRQIDRGRRARLDRDRRLPLRHRAIVALPPGCGDRARRRHPLYDLRDPAHAGQSLPRTGSGATSRAGCSRSSTGSAVASTASSSSTRPTRWPMPPATRARTRRKETVAAGPGRTAPAARAARRPHPLRLGDRRHDGAEPRLCRTARPLGHR